uniref:IPT/TIG domain-containing protein n=1 Tax=Alistipes sp. TaxID=1872444 RepID=UPI0040564B6B
MKNLRNNILKAVAAVALLLPVACDKTHINEVIESAPVIERFEPMSAPEGSEIIITGEFLNGVTTAKIGGVEVPIVERVSNTRLSIEASADATGGVITLVNATGETSSEEKFTYTYAAPEITTSILQASVDMGDQMLIAGRYMGAVRGVFFTAEGYDTANEAEIISRTAEELVVRCPYVEGDVARITLSYFDGIEEVTTPLESAPTIEVKRYVPQFDAVSFERTAVGKVVTLTGSYLDKVDKIMVGDFEAQLSKEYNRLQFTVPAGDFVDGDTTTSVVALYFDGHEQIVLSDSFVVYVPFVKFWEGMRVWGQGRDVEQMASFFSPETGQVYANSDWRELVDPISYQYQANTCSEKQMPNHAVITEEEYLSVNPYFFFSGVSAGQLQINSPANSNSQLRNFYMINNSADENRVTGVKGDCYGTPVLTFRYLSEANATEKALIDAVRNQTLEHIDEESFPIDVANKTVGGISVGSTKGSVNSDVWAPGVFTVGQAKANAEVDAVLMVLYYGYEGAVENVAANVRRIGFLHIRTVNFVLYNNTNAPSSSDVLFNMYWQKYDYDYSKIQ